MCIFSTLIIWKLNFKVQTSFSLFSLSKFCSPFFFSLHSSSLTFKLLSMVSYGGELVLDSSSTWSGVSNDLSSFFIPLPLIFKKQRTSLMKKIQGIQALHGATLCASAFATKVTTFHSSTSILEGWQWWSTYFLFLFKLMFFIMTNGEKLE